MNTYIYPRLAWGKEAHTRHRRSVPALLQSLFGTVLATRGYVSHSLFLASRVAAGDQQEQYC